MTVHSMCNYWGMFSLTCWVEEWYSIYILFLTKPKLQFVVVWHQCLPSTNAFAYVYYALVCLQPLFIAMDIPRALRLFRLY